MAVDINEPSFVYGVVQDAIYNARNAGLTIPAACTEAAEKLDPHIYSTATIADGPLAWVEPHDGEPAYQRRASRRMTWKEMYEREKATAARYLPAHQILSDLDRCEHGRHIKDECYGCPNGNQGNPFAGKGFGVSLYGEHYFVAPHGVVTVTAHDGTTRIVWED